MPRQIRIHRDEHPTGKHDQAEGDPQLREPLLAQGEPLLGRIATSVAQVPQEPESASANAPEVRDREEGAQEQFVDAEASEARQPKQ